MIPEPITTTEEILPVHCEKLRLVGPTMMRCLMEWHRDERHVFAACSPR